MCFRLAFACLLCLTPPTAARQHGPEPHDHPFACDHVRAPLPRPDSRRRHQAGRHLRRREHQRVSGQDHRLAPSLHRRRRLLAHRRALRLGHLRRGRHRPGPCRPRRCCPVFRQCHAERGRPRCCCPGCRGSLHCRPRRCSLLLDAVRGRRRGCTRWQQRYCRHSHRQPPSPSQALNLHCQPAHQDHQRQPRPRR